MIQRSSAPIGIRSLSLGPVSGIREKAEVRVMSRSFFWVLAGLALCFSSLVGAQSGSAVRGESVRYTYATVLSAVPVYETVRYTEPQEECSDERVVVRERDNGTAGAVIGAIIGGAIGNQVGGGDGRRAATVAGAIAGGAIGRDVDRRNGPNRQYEDVERRCYTVDVEREERRINGYDVEYRLKDEVYYARLPYDPGNNLRVRVEVTPVE